MARDREQAGSMSPSTGQSKRPPSGRDADSLASDQTQRPQQTQQQAHHHPAQQQQQQQHRKHQQRHHVGGGTGGRMHARVPSSKGLSRQNASSTKLHRRLTSPSPDRGTTANTNTNTNAAGLNSSSSSSVSNNNNNNNHHHHQNHHNHHQRKHSAHSSDLRLSRNPSATNLKKNASQTTLKRNKSHVEVGRRSKSSAQLKRSSSEKTVSKLKPSRSAVHFDIGTDGQFDDDDDDDDDVEEWVDASSSASPYLSRRGSVLTSGQSSAHAQGSPVARAGGGSRSSGSSNSDAAAAGEDDDSKHNGDEEPTPLAEPQRLLFDPTTQHSRTLTSRLLQRTPSHSATTSMSNMTALAKAAKAASPDSRHSASTLSVTPAQPQGVAGSNGVDEVTSRFITSQGSGGSFYTPAEAARAGKRPHSMGELPGGPGDTGLSAATTQVQEEEDEDDDDHDHDNAQRRRRRQQHHRGGGGGGDDDDDDELTDEEDTGITSAIVTTARSRKEGTVAGRSEKSWTQQKINLQRASSSMEPVRHRHSGIGGFAAEVAEVAGPLLGGAGYESQDPRVYKLLERTGVEYNIVRRYQNPVARSLARIAQLPGNDKARRIPRGAPPPSSSGRRSLQNFGLSQSFREPGAVGTEAATNGRLPETPRRSHSTTRHSGAGSSLDTDDGGGAAARMHEGPGSRLSGASLVNGEEDEGIQAILRSMWDKNLVDLATSAD